MAQLVTLQEARRFCGKDVGDNVDDQTILDIVLAVSNFAEQYCHRPWAKVTRTGKYFDGDGTDTLLLEYPIISIASLYADASRRFTADDLLTAWNESAGTGNYLLDPDAGIVTLVDGTVFPDGMKTIKATYDVGYATPSGKSTPAIPDNLKVGILRLCRKIFTETAGDVTAEASSETVGSYSVDYSASAQKVLDSSGQFDPEVKEIIKLHFQPFCADSIITGPRLAS